MEHVSQKASREWFTLTLLFITALCVRLLFWAGLGRALDSADAVHYVEMAKQFAAGDFRSFDPRMPVLYPLLGSLLGFVFDDIEFACRMVSLIASAAVVVPVYWLSRKLHGVPAARVAALIVATWPWLADYGSRVAPESLALFLWLTAVCYLARGLEKGGVGIVMAAVAFFGLNLTRPEGILLLLAAPFGGLILACGSTKNEVFKRLAVFVAASAVLLAGYVLVMRTVVGHASLSYRAANIAASTHYLSARAVELAKTFLKVLTEVIPVMLGPFFLIFAGAGVFQSDSKVRNLRFEAFALFFALVQLGAAVLSTYPEPRYTMAAIVVLMLWAAQGMAVVSARSREQGRSQFVALLPVTAMLALMAFGAASVFVPQWVGRIPRDPIEYRLAGTWMKEHLEPGLILTRKPQVGYYAGMKSFGPSTGATTETVRAEAEAAKARYVVIDERYTATMAPGLKPLLDASRPTPSGLRLVKSDVSPYRDARVAIFEVVPLPSDALPSSASVGR